MRTLWVTALLVLLLTGCRDSTRTEGGRIKITQTRLVDIVTGEILEETKTVDVAGARGETSQSGGAQALVSTPPTVEMNDKIIASAGELGIQSEGGGWEKTLAEPSVWLCAIGGLVIVISLIYGLFTKDWRGIVVPMVIGIGICGVALVFNRYPLVILALFLLGAGGIGYYLWQRNRKQKVEAEKKQVDETQQVFVRAIEGLDSETAKKVKARIADLSGKFKLAVKDVVSKAKRAAGVGGTGEEGK